MINAKRRAEIFIEETANSKFSTVFASNIVIKDLLAVNEILFDALEKIASCSTRVTAWEGKTARQALQRAGGGE